VLGANAAAGEHIAARERRIILKNFFMVKGCGILSEVNYVSADSC
jgi:hypothetical protein